MRHPLILDGGGSCSEVRVVCYDIKNEEIGPLTVTMGAKDTTPVELLPRTASIKVIPIVDLDI